MMTRADRSGVESPILMSALDRLGNREIQRIMSDYGTTDSLIRLVQKKKDETEKDTIDKIG